MKHEKMKKLTVLAMLSAIAYVAVALLRFPVVLFLSYEPKDVVIAIGGFLYGPAARRGRRRRTSSSPSAASSTGRWPHWASRLSSRSSRC